MGERTYMGIPREQIPWAPRIDADKCVGCGECLDVCPNGVFVMNEEAERMEIADPNNCVVLCDKCAEFCPVEAITFPDKEETKQLLKRMVSDRNQRK
ncbi:MAG: NADH-plastoquinone oxidoreductase subunit [Syntrophaceae bacterium PtaU1.Bin231]|nr:MAG: NADH-plastoquinone oxidoreductase subunit [Syntrophaceae bacterium PtaU1.Bin231]